MPIKLGVTAALVLVLLNAACASGAPGGPSTSPGGPGGGHAGQATLQIITQLGEQCPHIPVTPDPRCDPKPRPDTGFEVTTASGDVVTKGRTGSDARATVYVDPGTYVVRGEQISDWRITPQRPVTVSGTETLPVPLTYANGIQ